MQQANTGKRPRRATQRLGPPIAEPAAGRAVDAYDGYVAFAAVVLVLALVFGGMAALAVLPISVPICGGAFLLFKLWELYENRSGSGEVESTSERPTSRTEPHEVPTTSPRPSAERAPGRTIGPTVRGRVGHRAPPPS